jgi:hypothetical protein
MTLNLAAQTYWQPAKNLNITTRVIQWNKKISLSLFLLSVSVA